MDGIDRSHILAIDRENDVASAQACLRGGSVRHDLHGLNACRDGDAVTRRRRLRKRCGLPRKPKIAAYHAPFAHEIGNDPLRRIDGYGKARRVGTRDDGRVHADNAAPAVEERTAGIAGVQRGVGLYDVLDQAAGRRPQGPAQGADHTGRDRRLQAEGIAHGNDKLPDAQGIQIAKLDWREAPAPAMHPDKRGIRIRIAANEIGRSGAAVGKQNLDRTRALNDVIVGQHIAVGRDNKAGPCTALKARIALRDPRFCLPLNANHRTRNTIHNSGHDGGIGVERLLLTKVRAGAARGISVQTETDGNNHRCPFPCGNPPRRG